MLSRRYKVLSYIRNKLGISNRAAFTAVILYILKRFNLKHIRVDEFSTTPLGRFYESIRYTIELVEELGLKTLDLLHLAYIKTMKEQGIWIQSLLTADTDFKNNEENIKRILGITVDLIK